MKRINSIKKLINQNIFFINYFVALLVISSVVINCNLLLFWILILYFGFVRKIDFSKVSLIEVGFSILFISELLSTLFSEYSYNSLSSISKLSSVFFLYIIFRRFTNENFKDVFLLILSLGSYLLVLLTIREFHSHVQITSALGFNELNNLKNFYSPFGIFNNEWVSILLVFLPLNLLQLTKVKSIEYKIAMILLCGINVLCIIYSFSRGAYLCLLFFGIVMNYGVWKYYGFRKTLLINSVLATSVFLTLNLQPQVKKSFSTTISYNKTESQKRSINGRVTSLKEFKVILSNTPFFGFGQDNYVLSTYKKSLSSEDARFTPRAVNVVFQLLIERGFFGLICYLSFFSILIVVLLKSLREKKWSKGDRIRLIILFGGILVLVLRELTFSSFFSNDYLFFLSFVLIFFLAPYDINMEFNFRDSKRKKQNILKLVVVISLLAISILQIKRHYLQKLNHKFLQTFYKGSIDESIGIINSALRFDSNNLILNKHKAIAISKLAIKMEIARDFNSIIAVSILDKTKKEKLEEVLNEILLVNNYDDEIYHGLAWLSYIDKDFNSSEIYLKKAIELNPYKGIYYCSRAIFSDATNNPSVTQSSLSKVLQLNPAFLESRIFSEFLRKRPEITLKAKNQALRNLEKKIGNNSILKARYARLILDSEPRKAQVLLDEVTTNLPNLSRPWLYLTYLKELSHGQDFKDSTLVDRAIILNSNDYLTNAYFGDYFNKRRLDEETSFFYQNSLKHYNTLKSDGYKKNMFTSDLETLFNMEIPTELLFIFKPDIQPREKISFLEYHYKKENNTTQSIFYKNLRIESNYVIFEGSSFDYE